MANDSKTGNVKFEFVTGLVLFVPVVFVGIDLATLFLGAQFNNSTCEEAAKLAAAGPPEQVASRAGVVIARASQTNTTYGPSLTIVGSPVIDISGKPAAQLAVSGGPVTGTVSVTTQVLVRTAYLSIFQGDNTFALNATRVAQFTYAYPHPMAGSSGTATRE